MTSFTDKLRACKGVGEIDALWQGRASANAHGVAEKPTEAERQAYVTRRAELWKEVRG